MFEENPLPPWARHTLIGVGLFLAGAMLAFGYSYRPLHGALSWQVEQLESRLDERNRENVRLGDSLSKLQSNEATRIDPDTLAQVERELAQTKRVLNQAEKDLKRTDRKRKESIANATKWRQRFEELRDAPTPIATSIANPTPSVAPAAPASLPRDPGSTRSPEGSQPARERGILLPSESAESATR